MANLTETSTFPVGIYQLERTDPVDAGVGGSGISNLQPTQLAARTRYLKDVLDAVGLDLTNASLRVPSFAIASLPPAVPNARKVFYATNANAGAGSLVISDGAIWIDVRTGAAVSTSATSLVTGATTTTSGTVILATNGEAITGTDSNKAITSSALQAKINAIPSLGASTTTTSGTVILATNGEAITGTDSAKAITSSALQAKINAIPSLGAATTSTAGTVILATNAEALTGTNSTKSITPAALQAKVDTVTSPAATDTVPGIIQIATQVETRALTISNKAITPNSLAGILPSIAAAGGQFARVNNAGTAFSYTLENTSQLITVVGGTFAALANRYHFFRSACTVTLPIAPPEGTFIAFLNAQTSGTITISATGTDAHNATLAQNLRGNLIYSAGNWRNVGFAAGGFVASGSAVFAYTGANQDWVVPGGVTTATALIWAGGGGGGSGGVGGGSGFVQATFTTTPGETLTMIVGQGGDAWATSQAAIGPNAFGGGGAPSRQSGSSTWGAGGGRSGIRRSATELLTAGAGGGGSGFSGAGGVGGGSSGGVGGGFSGGGGGNQSVGGAIGNASGGNATGGSLNAGGNGSTSSPNNGGSGGGGGYYGGGGTDNNGGGGGSSFTGSGTTAESTTSGAGSVAANNTHPSYASGIGNGGSVSAPGGNGRIVIVWG